MPRKSRKDIVGQVEDDERTQCERSYATLEHELHQEWQQQPETGDVAATEAESYGDAATPSDDEK